MDAALANRMVALATQCDARCKRQVAAVAATQAAIAEIEVAIGNVVSPQGDLVNDAAAAEDAKGAPDPNRSSDLKRRR